MSDEDEPVELDGEIQGETDAAWKFHDGTITTWLPKSLCSWDRDAKQITIPMWLAVDRGLV